MSTIWSRMHGGRSEEHMQTNSYDHLSVLRILFLKALFPLHQSLHSRNCMATTHSMMIPPTTALVSQLSRALERVAPRGSWTKRSTSSADASPTAPAGWLTCGRSPSVLVNGASWVVRLWTTIQVHILHKW